ncbi:MAG: hypothetical protein ACE5J1_04335, partial [Nitrospiria bacterium]
MRSVIRRRSIKWLSMALWLIGFTLGCTPQTEIPPEDRAPSGWEVQEIGSEASLGGIFFIDSEKGWISGNKGT